MRELIQIVLGLLLVATLFWTYLRVCFFLYEHGLLGRRRIPRIEIQTLFHGNTKDQDQI